MNTRNLDAYYYSFEPTGCDEVDAILEQVAQAGAGYHSTADWKDKYADGSSPVSNMQRASEESAAQIKIIISERDQLKAENKRLAALLECAQGDLKQAMQIIEKQTAERQEWQKVLKMTQIPREGDQSKYSLALKDAERYRYLRTEVTRGGPYDFCIVRKNWGNPALERILTLEGADQEIDAAMSGEG